MLVMILKTMGLWEIGFWLDNSAKFDLVTNIFSAQGAFTKPDVTSYR